MAEINRILSLAAALMLGTSGAILANDPLSAIEWLEKRPKQIVVPLPTPNQLPKIDEPPVAGSIVTHQVTVTPLGAPVRAAAGLLPSTMTGLPRDLWVASEASTLIALLSALNVEGRSALQSLLFTLLLAEADPPSDARASEFLRARVQKLFSLGALDPAAALLQRADPAHIDLFDLYFDAALLNADADQPCKALAINPALSRDLERRIFCDVQSQNWDNAALTLATADAIGALEKVDVALLERFLDPELFADVDIPAPPSRPSVLQFRLFEAIGEALPTASLPRAFAATDLSGDAGWKTQLESAERLARVGAISENRLLGIYTSRVPSASGGVWDRAEAIQRLETAMNTGDPVAVVKQTKRAWALMQNAQLQIPFATLFAEKLLELPQTGTAGDADLITRIALLSPIYEQAAQRKTDDASLKAAQSIAIGEPIPSGPHSLYPAIVSAFSGKSIPQHLADLSSQGKLGEAILRAMSLAIVGSHGDPTAIQNGLGFLRSVGLEDTARRSALQLILLETDNRP